MLDPRPAQGTRDPQLKDDLQRLDRLALILEIPVRRFMNTMGVSPIRHPTIRHQNRISSWNE